MTREQLDAIRARLDEVPSIPWNASLLRLLNEDARALLAEVERLTAERDTAHGLLFGHTGFLGPCAHERDPWDRCDECGKGTAVEAAAKRVDALQAEVAKLHADPLPAAAWVREVERAAFARGVAAMREAAACAVRDRWTEAPERVVRALPDPEDKP